MTFSLLSATLVATIAMANVSPAAAQVTHTAVQNHTISHVINNATISHAIHNATTVTQIYNVTMTFVSDAPYQTGSEICGPTYWSVAGDDCNSIAANQSISVAEIQKSNGFLNCNDIWVNTPIAICWDNPRNSTSTRPASSSIPTQTGSEICDATYWSVAGDNCNAISVKLGISVAEIQKYNAFLNCNDIWVNTPVAICRDRPVSTRTASSTATQTGFEVCGPTYWSVAGDNCNSIAAKFGISPSEVKKYNAFLNCNDIWVNTPVAICSDSGVIPASR